MRENHLYVMSLEEYEPNREFVGRNFNAGEVIQLVLKSPRTGRWLPFDYVQMVMMHELAHCKQMNHSRAFWAVRNQYAAQMQGLWSKGYTGDGIWGRGINLGTAEWERNTVHADDMLPEHLCGGTYRSRRRKRKVKPTLTYQERKEQRILKKFGKNGVALGSDEETKIKLEKGKRVQGKPRVAGSARGRELRAAAALARFEQQKPEPSAIKDESETESGSESDYDDAASEDVDSKDALDVDGSRLTDKKGRGMIKVCEDENSEDPAARNELDELRGLMRTRRHTKGPSQDSDSDARTGGDRHVAVKQEEAESNPTNHPPANTFVKLEPLDDLPSIKDLQQSTSVSSSSKNRTMDRKPKEEPSQQQLQPTNVETNSRASEPIHFDTGTATCSMCSYANSKLSVTCAMCANVLNPTITTNSWRCTRESCKDSSFVNSGDCGVCGLCGQKKM